MTEQAIKEIIKSFAYGMTAEQVAENEEMSVDDAKEFQKVHASEIKEKKADLKEGGWLE